MCGRINVNKDPFMQMLLDDLFVQNPSQLRQSGFITPCDTVSIIVEKSGQRQLLDATWWLLLEQQKQGFKPSRYTSFHTRYDKLNQRSSAGFKPFRQSRCIIPASGFGETQRVNGKVTSYHDLQPTERAIAFAGLYRTWRHETTGESVHSCSIITNAPHIKLSWIHAKASPAMLPANLFEQWLDPALTDVSVFDEILRPKIDQRLQVQQINQPK
ncbi:MAG: SOS response-associated peptidase family protein [Psychrobium sp.]|nr:SOS response-associated peptidase family protein [Psychrobium sp.]